MSAMIEQTGTVTAKGNGRLHVRVDPSPGCARCEAGQGCGQGLIGQLAGQSAYGVPVPEPAGIEVDVGDVVVLGMAPSGLLLASSLVYLVPLMLMMLAALGAGVLWPGSEASAAVSGISGLAAGFAGVRYLVRDGRLRGQFEPQLLRRASGAADELLT